jgi:hypothetical protein
MRHLFLTLIIALSGCSHFIGSKREIYITSSPEGSEVSYQTQNEKGFKVLGTTPLLIDSNKISAWLKDGQDFVAIRLLKSGHMNETILVDIKARYNLKYEAELKPIDIWHNKEEEVSSAAANKLATKVQKINHLIFDKDLESALRTTEELIEQFPKAHVFFDVKGSILYLMGKNSEAMMSYQKSLNLNPENIGAQEMLEKIKGKQL